jgi:heptosyltransferase-2
MPDPGQVLVVAPNWLGDTVMALPAISDIRRTFSSARVVVTARRVVADLFKLVPAVDDVVPLQWTGNLLRRSVFAADAVRLREIGADVAILLPNSFASAWLVKQAAVPDRWGYSSDMRARLLSRPVPRPKRSLHQGAYYQHLTRALGIESGPLEPAVTVPDGAMAAARALLMDRGWDGLRPLVVFAPGAAYGTAKRWIPAYVARVAATLVRTRQAACVLVGSSADAGTTRDIRALMPSKAQRHVIDVTGDTSIDVVAAILRLARAAVSNDSGAMHLAGAVGTPLVALFGPTREDETGPLPRAGARAEVLTHPVWCRPCMLRECPIDHRCMKGILPERVLAALNPIMEAGWIPRSSSRS